MDDVWLGERGRQEQKDKLGKQRHRQDQRIIERKNSVPEPESIPLNTKDDPPPIGDPISDDDISDNYSFVESPHTESEVDFFEDVAPAAPPTPLPPEAPNISPEGETVPPNPSPEGDNPSPEGDNSRNPVWTRDKNNRVKRLKLNR